MALTMEEGALLGLVACSLRQNDAPEQGVSTTAANVAPVSWEALFELAQRHQLASLVAGPLAASEMPKVLLDQLTSEGRRTCLRFYRLAWDTRALCDLLEAEGMHPLVHKGYAAAAYYPVPELRKAGDIDLLVREEDIPRATEVLKAAGYTFLPGPPGDHHVRFATPRGFEIELHHRLARPFNRKSVDGVLEQVHDHALDGYRRVSAIPGIEAPTMGEAEFAFGLVIHMVQHQLRGGFGLRLLVDWVAFLNAEHDDTQMNRLNDYVERAGLMRFLSVVVACCVRWLGLDESKAYQLRLVEVDEPTVQKFLRDVISAGEFGNSMESALAAPEEATVAGFIREFHHQMLIRHPRASKVVPIWPVLWGNTLFQFMRNNRKLRHISTLEVLRTAFKRGKTMGGLKLFETEDP